MDGKKFKKIVSRIPDNADVVSLTEKYIAWRGSDGKLSAYSFHPEKLDEDPYKG